MREYSLTPEAQRDFDAIIDHISAEASFER